MGRNMAPTRTGQHVLTLRPLLTSGVSARQDDASLTPRPLAIDRLAGSQPAHRAAADAAPPALFLPRTLEEIDANASLVDKATPAEEVRLTAALQSLIGAKEKIDAFAAEVGWPMKVFE
jgi:hypothetical protein